ncbi:hypothetical protein CEXT_796621 [Caerostris extrusa]|uniref:Uncharacterized protein n=1 Tax=Caerostris extrusa TaxID=172846 RepID=A0AAV4WSH7_CAEEX|nr:hypothetical protein CEXT_796621 [Caerostris extrusa]
MFPNLMIYLHSALHRSMQIPIEVGAACTNECNNVPWPENRRFFVCLYIFKEESDNSVNTGNQKLIKRWISFPPALYVNLKHVLISLGWIQFREGLLLVLLEDKILAMQPFLSEVRRERV